MRERLGKMWQFWGHVDAARGLVETTSLAARLLSGVGVVSLLVVIPIRVIGWIGDWWFLIAGVTGLAVAIAPWLIVRRQLSTEERRRVLKDRLREARDVGDQMVGVAEPEMEWRWARHTGDLIRDALGKDQEALFFSDEGLPDKRMDNLGRRLVRLDELIDRLDSLAARRDWLSG